MNNQSKAPSLGRRAVRLHEGSADSLLKSTSTTKALLLDTAELLFARYGLEGISLREIAKAAGQSNSNVVRYHFGDKAALINAILNDRMRKMDVLRGALIKKLKKTEYNDTRKVLKCLWLPWTLLKSNDESHSFCQFYLHYALHPGIVRHPIFESISVGDRIGEYSESAEKEFPNTIFLMKLLDEQFPLMPKEIFRKRILLIGMMYFASVAQHDYYDNIHLGKRKPAKFDIEPILDMALGALHAPT